MVDVESAAADALRKPKVVGLLMEVNAGPKTVVELSRGLKTSESNVRRYVRTTLRRGLIEVTLGIDGRRKFIKLTSLGVQVLSRVTDTLKGEIDRECATEVVEDSIPYPTPYHLASNFSIKRIKAISRRCAEGIIKAYYPDPMKILRMLRYTGTASGDYLTKTM